MVSTDQRLHDIWDLEQLQKRRKPLHKILETISKQKLKKFRSKTECERYLTTCLYQIRKYLISDEEPILFYEYPISKVLGTQKVDLVYAFLEDHIWKLGLLEAKILGGQNYEKALTQLLEYRQKINDSLEQRKSIFEGLLRNRMEDKLICFPDSLSISRLDILAPEGWWKNNLNRKITNLQDGVIIRHLYCNDDFIPENLTPEDIFIKLLPSGM